MQKAERVWTILGLINWGAEYLKGKGFEDSRLNVELLLCSVLGCKRIDLYTRFDKPLNQGELGEFRELLKRRLRHEPLQYILGETEFMSLRFFVDRNVLIPRPETEVLVEQIIKTCRGDFRGSSRVSMIDIGTGSGNIAISVSKFVENVECVGIDVSDEASAVARKNAEYHQVSGRVEFLRLDVFDDLSKKLNRKFDIVASNPPYVPASEFEHLQPEIRDYEPRAATCDEEDGLKFFRRICELGGGLSNENGFIFFEVGYNQASEVKELLEGTGYGDVTVTKDYAGVERVVGGKRMGE